MEWEELCVVASYRTLSRVLHRALLDPLLNAFAAEGSLTLLALDWFENNFHANLTDKE